jgi:hypothetical protein
MKLAHHFTASNTSSATTIFAVQSRRQHLSRRPFTHSARAGKKPSMISIVGIQRTDNSLKRLILTYYP